MAFIRMGERWESQVTLNVAAIDLIRTDGAVVLRNGDIIEYLFGRLEGPRAQRAVERAIEKALATSTVVPVETP